MLQEICFIVQKEKKIFSNRVVEDGFRKAFKGNWGASAHTKKMGVVQDLNRLSYNATLSHFSSTIPHDIFPFAPISGLVDWLRF